MNYSFLFCDVCYGISGCPVCTPEEEEFFDECDMCEGTGVLHEDGEEDVPCDFCDGEGKIPVEEREEEWRDEVRYFEEEYKN